MKQFVTEFPVGSSLDGNGFIAEIIAWIRGIKNSRVLENARKNELDENAVDLKVDATGESLALRRVSLEDGTEASGFRHEIGDDKGRLWRTEGVFRQGDEGLRDTSRIVQIRSSCLAAEPNAVLDVPRKPYLVKMLVKEGHGATDGDFPLQDRPQLLAAGEKDLEKAARAILGNGSFCLPIVYISSQAQGGWALERRALDKLAFELGGVAHVVLEPSREFSFRLRDRTKGKNPYDGSVGIILPGSGMHRRLFRGWRLPGPDDLYEEIMWAAKTSRSFLPTKGWDWPRLLEAHARLISRREREKLGMDEIEELLKDEIEAKDERIRALEAEIEDLREVLARQTRDMALAGDGILNPAFEEKLGPQVYEGEFSDRLRAVVRECVERGQDRGWDARSIAVFERILKSSEATGRAKALAAELDRATRDKNKLHKEVPKLLQRHGYERKSDNKHIKMVPGHDFPGLQMVMVAKTPSENRGLKYLASQIEKAMGLARLK